MSDLRLSIRGLTSILLILSTITSPSNAVVQMSCYCPTQPGAITYTGACPGSNEMMVVKRTLVAMTLDRSSPDFCSRTVSFDTRHCVITDTVSDWLVRSQCNSKSGNCQVSFNLPDDTFSTCPSQNGWVYACLEYDCTNKSSVPNVVGATIFLSSSNQRSYTVTSRFHLMTSYYPSAARDTINQCTLVVPATANAILRVWDLRGQFTGPVADERSCPYHLYIATGVDYKEWCAQYNWNYAELMVAPSGGSGNRSIDVVFNAQFPQLSAEGAVWVTVEASTATIVILCGDNIPLHSVPPPTGTRTMPITTTRAQGVPTTTRFLGPPGNPSDASTSQQTTTTRQPIGPPGQPSTTLGQGQQSSTTTRQPVGPPGQPSTTLGQGQQSSTTTRQPVGPPGQPSTTLGQGQQSSTTTRQPVGPPGQPSTTLGQGQQSSTTTRQPVGPPGQPSTTLGQGQQSSTTTRQPVGPPGQETTTTGQQPGQQTSSTTTSSTTTRFAGPPGQPSTTLGQQPGQPSSSTTTTRQQQGQSSSTTTRQPVGPPGLSSTGQQQGQPSSSTTRQPIGPPGQPSTTTTRRSAEVSQSSTTKTSGSVSPVGPVGPTIGPPPGQSTTRVSPGAVEGSTTTLGPQVSFKSGTPGVPTPGVPARSQAVVSSGPGWNVKTVAITVAVIVVGLILIVALVMALVWFFSLRHKDNGYQGGLNSMSSSGYRATIE